MSVKFYKMTSMKMAIVPIALLLIACGSQREIKQYDGYQLVFHDEFDYRGAPDPQKWNYEEGFIRNREPQWYQKENVMVENGVLTITAKEEFAENKNYEAHSDDWRHNRKSANYTSSSVISKGHFEFKFGKVQMRAKIDVTQGQWPAFWMLGVNRGPVPWPACGEVDILEYYRGQMHANLAWEGKDGKSKWSPKSHNIADLGDPEFWKKFHIWTLDWDPDYMRIYIDDYLLNETKISDIKNGVRGNQPFHEKFYLVMNLALSQGGEEIAPNSLPSKYIIDFVRVYQKRE